MHWGYYFFTRHFKARPENKQNPLLTYSKFLKDSLYFCSYFKMAIHTHTHKQIQQTWQYILRLTTLKKIRQETVDPCSKFIVLP